MTVELRARKSNLTTEIDNKDHECILIKEYIDENMVDNPGAGHYYTSKRDEYRLWRTWERTKNMSTHARREIIMYSKLNCNISSISA